MSAPVAAWAEVAPYVRSHVVPWLRDGEFHVDICSDQVLREVVTPYDDSLGDFAKVLLSEGLRRDPKIVDAVAEATEAYRARVPGMDSTERAAYRESFWRDLSGDERFLPRLERLYEKAQSKGRLRCSLCEHDASFTPLGLGGG